MSGVAPEVSCEAPEVSGEASEVSGEWTRSAALPHKSNMVVIVGDSRANTGDV